MIQPGDIFLSKPVRGVKLIQEAICWWTNSEYSHAEMAVDNHGSSVDFKWPIAIQSNVSNYFDSKHRVLVLRPAFIFDADMLMQFLRSKKGTRYALCEYLGFITNKNFTNKDEWHCGSGNLAAYQAAGGLLPAGNHFVSPQTFIHYAEAGAFEVVARLFRPTITDFEMLQRRTWQ